MNHSVYAPNSLFNIAKGLLQALKDRMEESRRWILLVFLCAFFGIFGLHRFVEKRWGSGILYLLTLGFLGIGVISDLISLFTEKFLDKQKKPILSGLKGTQRFTLFCVLLLGIEWLFMHYTQIPILSGLLSMALEWKENLLADSGSWLAWITGKLENLLNFIDSL